MMFSCCETYVSAALDFAQGGNSRRAVGRTHGTYLMLKQEARKHTGVDTTHAFSRGVRRQGMQLDFGAMHTCMYGIYGLDWTGLDRTGPYN